MNASLDYFYNKLYEIISCTVPIRTARQPKYPRWFKRDVINAINTKKMLHKRYTISNDLADYIEFKRQRSYCKKLINTSYAGYVRNVESNIIDDPRVFWNFGNPKTADLPNRMSFNGNDLSMQSDIANAFAQHFSDNFNCTNVNVDINMNISHNSLCSITIDHDDLRNRHLAVNVGLAAGPNGLPAIFLRECANNLSLPLFIISNKIIRSGIFPHFWKKTYITPIHKKKKNQILLIIDQ